MALNTAFLESILALIVAVLFAVAGVVNLAGRGAVKRIALSSESQYRASGVVGTERIVAPAMMKPKVWMG